MRSLSTILTVVFALATSAAFAEDSGWKLPNLNPFSSSPKRTKARVSDNSWMSMPKVPSMPGFKRGASRSRKQQPSTMTKMTQGTKNFFSKTYDVLTPWDNNAPKKPPTRLGTRRKPDESEGGLFSWFGSDEPEEPQTVGDFLRQGRPGFDE